MHQLLLFLTQFAFQLRGGHGCRLIHQLMGIRIQAAAQTAFRAEFPTLRGLQAS